eukprot:TRINITY_DN65505_c0_g1_i1.p1 TRINITY_DN65505_c0_g1~~TRINITY_DN65505_c0_g1_i1.p1  ORF type:complete len:571 (-),score=118.48 TRINITY_DN65505_c0_g1_i1:120-1832(-)
MQVAASPSAPLRYFPSQLPARPLAARYVVSVAPSYAPAVCMDTAADRKPMQRVQQQLVSPRRLSSGSRSHAAVAPAVSSSSSNSLHVLAVAPPRLDLQRCRSADAKMLSTPRQAFRSGSGTSLASSSEAGGAACGSLRLAITPRGLPSARREERRRLQELQREQRQLIEDSVAEHIIWRSIPGSPLQSARAEVARAEPAAASPQPVSRRSSLAELAEQAAARTKDVASNSGCYSTPRKSPRPSPRPSPRAPDSARGKSPDSARGKPSTNGKLMDAQAARLTTVMQQNAELAKRATGELAGKRRVMEERLKALQAGSRQATAAQTTKRRADKLSESAGGVVGARSRRKSEATPSTSLMHRATASTAAAVRKAKASPVLPKSPAQRPPKQAVQEEPQAAQPSVPSIAAAVQQLLPSAEGILANGLEGDSEGALAPVQLRPVQLPAPRESPLGKAVAARPSPRGSPGAGGGKPELGSPSVPSNSDTTMRMQNLAEHIEKAIADVRSFVLDKRTSQRSMPQVVAPAPGNRRMSSVPEETGSASSSADGSSAAPDGDEAGIVQLSSPAMADLMGV